VCCHKIILNSGRKAPEGIMLMFGDIQISYLFGKYLPASWALSPRPEAFDPVKALLWTLCIG